jgi:hypothetical protein
MNDDAVDMWKDAGRPDPVWFATRGMPGVIRSHVPGCTNETHALYLAHGDGTECNANAKETP